MKQGPTVSGRVEEGPTGPTIRRRVARAAAAGAIVLGVLAPTAAFAQTYPNGGTTPPKANDPGAQVQGVSATNNSSSLPFTGGDVAGLAAIGGGAVVVGGLLALRSRRSHA
ncbi:MAG TPA: hypothetical protein VFC33_11275 [Acidimicrobiia bacterium]|nr:hypothetical protein [Acidimicrobiia bacterium]